MKIPEGWVYCTSEMDEDEAWRMAIQLKGRREELRPDLFVRVKVVRGYGKAHGSWWVLRKDEPRVKEMKA